MSVRGEEYQDMFTRKKVLVVATVLIVTLLSGILLPGFVAALPGMPFDVVDKIADPDTWGRPPNQRQMGFIELPRIHDGRIWTDKTVRTSGGFGGIPAATQPDEFVVTFSALSQVSPLMDGYQIPTDTVFIIDVSGSMRQMRDAGDNRMRIDVLIEALNEAIAILQGAHPLNRIAVVAYGGGDPGTGNARVERLLPLGRYIPPDFGSGPAPGLGVNEFFSYIPNPTASIPAGATFSQYHHLRVNDIAAQTGFGSRIPQRTILVNGSTPTQWGIYEGATILEGASTTVKVDKTDISGVATEITVTRRPNIVLMTDGEPTIGWTNYSFAPDPSNAVTPPGKAVPLHSPGVIPPDPTAIYFGDGSYGEMGVSIMTVLTAAHRKREVLNSYFPLGMGPGEWDGDTPPSDQEHSQPKPSVGFYTIAFGSQPTQATKDLIRATLDPFGNSLLPSPIPSANPTKNHAGAVNADIRRRNTGHPDSLTGDPNYGIIFNQNPWSDPALGGSRYNPNMGELLNTFASSSSASITFNAARRQASVPSKTSFVWDNARVALNNDVAELTLEELNYATMFREASNLDDIRKVFQEITTSIQEQGVNYTVTATQEDPNFSGYLVFSDVLGEYMQVRTVGGIEFNNTLFSRDGFAAAVASPGSARDSFVNILFEHMNYGTPNTDPRYLSKSSVAEIVAANAASADFMARNNLKYYANTNRDFVGNFYNSNGTPAVIPPNAAAVVEVFPMWGTMNEGVAPPPGNVRDLRLITFHVITALRDGGFEEIFAKGIAPPNKPMTRMLKAGEQMVRWYVPESLIPLRIPQFSTGGFSGFVGNTHPIRVSYTVGLDREHVRTGLSEDYINRNRVPGSTDRYYFYANRHFSARPDIDNSNLTLAFFQPANENPFYLLDQQRGAVKISNPTETARHVVVNRTLAYQSAENIDLDWLGNNGRLTLQFSEPPPPSPQTGDNRTLLLPIAVISLGVLFLAGAEVYRRKHINKANE